LHLFNSAHSSLFLAKQILQLHHFPEPASKPFMSVEKAATLKVLELGAGTGVLGILLHQLFASWTSSDQYDNLKLIARNVKHNGEPQNLRVEEVDWMDVHQEWTKAKQAPAKSTNANVRKGSDEEYDLIMAVDCIYNDALIPPFVSTLEHYTTKGKTIVMVVCELRSADVVSDSRLPVREASVADERNALIYR
jgi:predicted nicotinamide N-methyase